MKKLIPAPASLLSVVIVVCGLAPSMALMRGLAQQMGTPEVSDFHTTASNLVIPQSRAYAMRPEAQLVKISEVAADVRILQQVATTTMDVALANPGTRQQEAEMLVPVPDGAVVRSFTFAGSASEPTAKLLPKVEAQTIYRSIVSKLRDPALLEF